MIQKRNIFLTRFKYFFSFFYEYEYEIGNSELLFSV